MLYLVQRTVITFDSWPLRIDAPEMPDLAVLDLDPMPGVKFDLVRDVARWVHGARSLEYPQLSQDLRFQWPPCLDSRGLR